LILALAFTTTVKAQGPDEGQHSDAYWVVHYWNNVSLSGEQVAEGTDEEIDWDWGSGRPHDGVNADIFSARWSKYIDVSAGTYRFTATADDGIRVYVDGHRIIDEWYDHSVQTFVADISLTEGHHLIVVEYYENLGEAVAKVTWAPAPAEIHHWRGEYFANASLSGTPVLVRDDTHIDFDWTTGSPASGVPSDHFSVRWTQNVDFGSGGLYRFTAAADDGVRLWVNNHHLIDKWVDQAFTSYSDTIYISGNVPIKMEYYENGGLAAARLTWERIGGTTPPPDPHAIIVDDTDPGFVRGGVAGGWRTAAEGYGNRLTWTRNNDYARYNYNWARWYPGLTPGRYEVFVYIPYRYTTTSAARYWVSHRDGYTLRVVDQSVNGDRWVSLGTYWFRGTQTDYVSLADVTYERRLSRLIGFDAVKWVSR
jgi:hypothetical protein